MTQKIINDTLKTPSGKWSRKSLTMFSSWVMAVLTGSYIVIANYFTTTPVNENSIQVFYGFLLLAGGTSATIVYEKLKNGVETVKEE